MSDRLSQEDKTDQNSEESGSGSGSGSDSEEDGDVKMDTDEDAKPSDPNDLSAYNLDNYDEETSRGTGMLDLSAVVAVTDLQPWELSPT